MINKSKLAIIAAVAAVGFASPAFAQSFSNGWGTGNVLPYTYGAPAPRNDTVAVPRGRHPRIADRRSGLEAYAMIPRSPAASSAANANDAADTGGGSVGYNRMLETY
jgi:hypothetical protein